MNTLAKGDASELQLNEIGQCQLSLNKLISFDAYADIKGTGSFVVIDKYTHATLAAGMIKGTVETAGKKAQLRQYTSFEKELNAMVREHYPEWGCKLID